MRSFHKPSCSPGQLSTWQLCYKAFNCQMRGYSNCAPGGQVRVPTGSLWHPVLLWIFPGHMQRICPINTFGQTVEVEPGVVLDDLNRRLAPHGYFFAPTLSPSDRATIGGMIGTNACGKGSRVYGRTVDHVQEVQIVLIDGTIATLSEMDLPQARQRSRQNDTLGRIFRDVLEVEESTKQLVDSTWLQMPRSPSGYNLRKVISKNGTRFSLIP